MGNLIKYFKFDKDIIKGFKIGLGFISAIILFFTIVYAGSHYANNILGGTFLGNYTFQNKLTINNSLMLGNINLTPANNEIIYLNNSMTAYEIQEIINSTSKYIPVDKSITFQFKDGEYKLDSPLNFKGFFGGGTLYIQGNRSEENASQLHTSQRVFLNFTNNSNLGIRINNPSIMSLVYNLKIYSNSDYWVSGISMYSISRLYYSYVYSDNSSTSRGFLCQNSFCYLVNNYVSNLHDGIIAKMGGKIFSYNNDDYSTLPVYGLSAADGAVIAKYSTQPDGSTANENAWAGGVIR